MPTAAPPTATVRSAPIDVESLCSAILQRSDGAVVSFTGVVRDHDHDRTVVALRYEAHPTAEDRMHELLAEVRGRHPLARLAVAHRVGDLRVGDVAFAVAATASHRGEAFAACSDAVETVKAELPIWKLQEFSDGSSEWVNCA